MTRPARRLAVLALLLLPATPPSCAPPPAGPLAGRSSPARPLPRPRPRDDAPAIPPDAWPGAPPGRGAVADDDGPALPPAVYDDLTSRRAALGPDPEPSRRKSVPDPPARLDEMADRLVEAHNRERKSAGLPPLSVSSMLMASAQAHADDMAGMARMDHTGSDGSSAHERIGRRGYPSINTGENIAAGYRTVAQAMAGWMKSRGHRANVLGAFNEIGVGLARGADGMPYWCVNFGRRWYVLDPEEAAAEAVERINAARGSEGLPPLRADPTLLAVARRHAFAMSRRRRVVAIDDLGLHPLERARRVGYPFAASGLGTGTGQADPEELVRDWLADPRSRRLLHGDFADVGVGYAADPVGTPFWSLIVGTPVGP